MLNEQLAVRFNVSVAVQLTSVVPIGNVVPDCGVHATPTEPCPSVVDGLSKVIATPPAFVVDRAIPATQDIDGAFATGGGGGGGGGVGAVGVLLHAAPIKSETKATTIAERTAQYFTHSMNLN
jgi:hypothetical protein